MVTLSGFPGNYMMRQGLTGVTLAEGDRDQILKALGVALADYPDNYSPPTYGKENLNG